MPRLDPIEIMSRAERAATPAEDTPPMTEERLEEIHAVRARYGEHSIQLAHYAAELLHELDRLRAALAGAPQADFAGLRALAEKATPGPWRSEEYDDGFRVVGAGADPWNICLADLCIDGDDDGSAHAAYIAACSPNVIIALLDSLAALQQRAERAEGENTRLRRSLETSTVRLEICRERFAGCDDEGDPNNPRHPVSALELPAWIEEQRAALASPAERTDRDDKGGHECFVTAVCQRDNGGCAVQEDGRCDVCGSSVTPMPKGDA